MYETYAGSVLLSASGCNVLLGPKCHDVIFEFDGGHCLIYLVSAIWSMVSLTWISIGDQLSTSFG